MTTTTEIHPIHITEQAANKAARLLAMENRDDLSLRIAVQPGGCSGLRYQIFFDNRSLDGDEKWVIETHEGVLPLSVDKLSAPYLLGSELDYADQIDKQGFTIDNPNASGACACGDSFY